MFIVRNKTVAPGSQKFFKEKLFVTDSCREDKKYENMLNFLKSLLGIILVALLGYGLYRMATQNTDNATKILRVAPDNTTTIAGTVLENKKDCFDQPFGSKCFLRMRVAGEDLYVIYNTNDAFYCVNENAAATGKNIKEGDTVKVFGFYKRDENLDTILTCPTVGYFIQTL